MEEKNSKYSPGSVSMGSNHDYEEQVLVDLAIDVVGLHDLIIFNDDYNTFDHVTNTLIKVCKHSSEQAEQCTYLIHYKGKCAVKHGDMEFLKPMKDAICEAGIDAKVL